MTWPYSKDDAPARTHDATFTVANNLVPHKVADSRDINLGIKGVSPLFLLNDFDVIQDIPMEGMHLAFEGVAAMLLK